jgi:hypothetical protein
VASLGSEPRMNTGGFSHKFQPFAHVVHAPGV